MDALVDELLLARGVSRDDLARHRDPTDPRLPARSELLPGHGQGREAPRRCGPGAARRIAIFGDYDVDGATSAALLVLLLRRLGAEPMVYIPDRLMEGYGPSGKALVELKARGASVAVCVDCGAQAFEALEEASAAGLDVIVVDHHQCASLLPVAFAMINPNRLDESDGRRGARASRRGRDGVPAWRRAGARASRTRLSSRRSREPKILDLLDLVALGTVADVARLKSAQPRLRHARA